jgi:hypothetical protein
LSASASWKAFIIAEIGLVAALSAGADVSRQRDEFLEHLYGRQSIRVIAGNGGLTALEGRADRRF